MSKKLTDEQNEDFAIGNSDLRVIHGLLGTRTKRRLFGGLVKENE